MTDNRCTSKTLRITRCVCFNRTFAELKDEADRVGARSVADLQEHVDFGRGCTTCHPYVRRMLRTGQTVFGQIIREEDEPDPEQ